MQNSHHSNFLLVSAMPTDVHLQFSEGPRFPTTLALFDVQATRDRKCLIFCVNGILMFTTFYVSAREDEKPPRQRGPRQALRHMHTLIKMEIKKFCFEKLRNMGAFICLAIYALKMLA